MQKRQNSAVVVAGLVVALFTVYLNSFVAAQVTSDLSPTRYLEHVKYLASDEMKGRASGSAELDKAADYISEQFRNAGLRPMGDDNTFFQKFQVTTGVALGTANELQINGTSFKINEPLSASANTPFPHDHRTSLSST